MGVGLTLRLGWGSAIYRSKEDIIRQRRSKVDKFCHLVEHIGREFLCNYAVLELKGKFSNWVIRDQFHYPNPTSTPHKPHPYPNPNLNLAFWLGVSYYALFHLVSWLSWKLSIYSKTSKTMFILTLILLIRRFKFTDHQTLNMNLNLNLTMNLNLHLNLNINLNITSKGIS